MIERITKQRLNVIMLIDISTSMRGSRIESVNQAILEIKNELTKMEEETLNVDFYLTIIPFGTTSYFYDDLAMIRVTDLDFKPIKAGGWSKLELGYEKLLEIMKKESNGGIMPDFGGVAPIIMLLSDGHPTKDLYKTSLNELKKLSWFNVALRYGIAIEKDDYICSKVLREFVENNGDVIKCYDVSLLKKIIKIVVLTASKVKSSSTDISSHVSKKSSNQIVQQNVSKALAETEDWEW